MEKEDSGAVKLLGPQLDLTEHVNMLSVYPTAAFHSSQKSEFGARNKVTVGAVPLKSQEIVRCCCC